MPTEGKGGRSDAAESSDAIVTLLLQSVTFEKYAVDARKLPLSEEEGILRFSHSWRPNQGLTNMGREYGQSNFTVQTNCYMKIYNLQ
jgi:hypothetical protein